MAGPHFAGRAPTPFDKQANATPPRGVAHESAKASPMPASDAMAKLDRCFMELVAIRDELHRVADALEPQAKAEQATKPEPEK